LVWDLTSGIGSPVSVHPRTPDGYSAALRRFYELETAVHPPFFRRTGGGWVMLNVLIGVVLSFGLFFLEAVGAVSIREEILDGPQEPSDGAYAGTLLISIVAGLLGWLLFCYLRSPLSRGLWLAVTYVAAFVAGVIMLASSVG
jgi:hypothetical protein